MSKKSLKEDKGEVLTKSNKNYKTSKCKNLLCKPCLEEEEERNFQIDCLKAPRAIPRDEDGQIESLSSGTNRHGRGIRQRERRRVNG